VLNTDPRSKPTVDALARSSVAFERAFVDAITKMGRVGVKTTTAQGNVRRDWRPARLRFWMLIADVGY
jgi:peroxidase